MNRFLCQLCNTIVHCGEKHPCFFYSNDEDFFTILKPAESEETDNKPDTRLEKVYAGNCSDISMTTYSNFRENNVEGTTKVFSQTANKNEQISLVSTSKRKRKYPSLLAGTSNNVWSLSFRNSSLDYAANNRKGEYYSRGNDSTSQSFWNSEKLKSQTTLANTVFSLCKKELFEFDPSKNIMETISTRADMNSFSSNSLVEFYSKQSQASMKDFEVGGVPAIGTRSHTSDSKLKHSCDLCLRQFEHKIALIRHYRTHTEENSYKCDTCGKQFSRKSSLKTHQLTHTGLKPFKCDVCGRGFNLKGNLDTHYRMHTGEKPFACETCGKRFIQKVSLDIHSWTHTGEKPFVCDFCKERFAAKSSLRRHAAESHTQERPFKCGVCGKAFKRNHERNRHRKIH